MAELLTDDQVRAAMQFLNGVKVDLRRRPRRTPPAPPKLDRACTDCGLTLPLRAFVRIRSRPHGYYGRCRACRARRARERYQNGPIRARGPEGACATQQLETQAGSQGNRLPRANLAR